MQGPGREASVHISEIKRAHSASKECGCGMLICLLEMRLSMCGSIYADCWRWVHKSPKP